MQKNLFYAGSVILCITIVVLTATLFLQSKEIDRLSYELDKVKVSPEVSGSVKDSANKRLVEECMQKTDLNIECRAIALSDDSLCLNSKEPQECKLMTRIVKISKKISADCDLESDYAAVCNAALEQKIEFCDSAGDLNVLCQALFKSDFSVCDSYDDDYTKDRCKGLVLWVSAVNLQSHAVCDQISYVSDSLACHASLAPESDVCDVLTKKTCELIVEPQTRW